MFVGVLMYVVPPENLYTIDSLVPLSGALNVLWPGSAGKYFNSILNSILNTFVVFCTCT